MGRTIKYPGKLLASPSNPRINLIVSGTYPALHRYYCICTRRRLNNTHTYSHSQTPRNILFILNGEHKLSRAEGKGKKTVQLIFLHFILSCNATILHPMEHSKLNPLPRSGVRDDAIQPKKRSTTIHIFPSPWQQLASFRRLERLLKP